MSDFPSITAQSLDAKFAPKQRRYASSFSASYWHHPSPPPRLAPPAPAPHPTFEALRAAAAHLNLPGQDEQHGPPMAATRSRQRHPVRKALLGATTALALCALAVGGYGAWVVREPDGSLASSTMILAALAQRFHDLTANQAVFRRIGEKIALLQPAASSSPTTEPASSPSQNPVAEILAVPTGLDASNPVAAATSELLKTAEAAIPTPEAARQADPVPAQAEPGATAPAAPVASPNGAEMAAASVPTIVTAQQLVDTLALVRQMSLLVRDMQAENEALRTQVTSLSGAVQAKMANLEQRLVAAAHDENAQLHAQMATLADDLQAGSKALEQRLGLALARGLSSAVPESGGQQAETPPPAAAPARDGDVAAADAMTPGAARTARDYRVQAASLGIAVLADANAPPGQAAGRLVAVGDQVPGVGRVTSIAQRGTSWIVQTDHGTIE